MATNEQISAWFNVLQTRARQAITADEENEADRQVKLELAEAGINIAEAIVIAINTIANGGAQR